MAGALVGYGLKKVAKKIATKAKAKGKGKPSPKTEAARAKREAAYDRLVAHESTKAGNAPGGPIPVKRKGPPPARGESNAWPVAGTGAAVAGSGTAAKSMQKSKTKDPEGSRSRTSKQRDR